MKRPCVCDRAVVGTWDKSQCRSCWLYKNDERYQRLWDGKDQLPKERKPSASPVRRAPCINLGLPVLHQPPCGCGEKLRACDVHEVCRVSVEKDNVACCQTCPDYEALTRT